MLIYYTDEVRPRGTVLPSQNRGFSGATICTICNYFYFRYFGNHVCEAGA